MNERASVACPAGRATPRRSAGASRRPARRPSWRRCRGSAILEFLLLLPVLGAILGMTFFFGWGYTKRHQVVVANRYATWQRVDNRAWPSEEKLNRVCFGGRAAGVTLISMGLDRSTARDLTAEAATHGQRTEALCDELVLKRLPGGHRARVSARFASTVALWQQFSHDIQSGHAREGITWRREEVDCLTALRDQFYPELDTALRGVPAPGDGMANIIRRLYLVHW